MAKILFHHIPKTAGTSLIERAQEVFGSRVCEGRYDDQVSEAQIRDDRLTFYHGHFSRRFVLRFRSLAPDAIIFTFVRHPFNRTLSQYHNWTDRARVLRELSVIAAASGSTRQLRALRDKFEDTILSMSLESFLTSHDPDVLQATDNVQAQYMTLADAKPNHLRFHAAATNAIGFYDFIGLQELFSPCLRLVEAKCGLPAGTFGGEARANDSDYAKVAGRYRVTSREMALLEGRNVYDLAVYSVCHALLLKLYGEWMPAAAFEFDRLVDLPEVVEIPRRGGALAPSMPYRH